VPEPKEAVKLLGMSGGLLFSSQNEKSYLSPAVVAMLCDRVCDPVRNRAPKLPECAMLLQVAVPDQSGGGDEPSVEQLSKPGSATRFARAGLTEAISRPAAKADAMATGRAHRVIMAFPPRDVAPAAFIPRRVTARSRRYQDSFSNRSSTPEAKKDRAGETRPFPFQQEILGLAVPTTPKAAAMEAAGYAVAKTTGVGETYTVIEAAAHAMADAVVAAARDIISTIGQPAVGEAGVAVVGGTAPARVGH
jgi:hypothetical protein